MCRRTNEGEAYSLPIGFSTTGTSPATNFDEVLGVLVDSSPPFKERYQAAAFGPSTGSMGRTVRNYYAHATRATSSWLLTYYHPFGGARSAIPSNRALLSVESEEPVEWLLDSEPLPLSLDAAVPVSTVVDEFKSVGQEQIASRINDLYRLSEEDPDEVPIDGGSLRHFASFLMEHRRLPVPKIAVTPSGHMQVEWDTVAGVLAMEFLGSGDINYAGIPNPEAPDRSSFYGIASVSNVLNAHPLIHGWF